MYSIVTYHSAGRTNKLCMQAQQNKCHCTKSAIKAISQQSSQHVDTKKNNAWSQIWTHILNEQVASVLQITAATFKYTIAHLQVSTSIKLANVGQMFLQITQVAMLICNKVFDMFILVRSL